MLFWWDASGFLTSKNKFYLVLIAITISWINLLKHTWPCKKRRKKNYDLLILLRLWLLLLLLLLFGSKYFVYYYTQHPTHIHKTTTVLFKSKGCPSMVKSHTEFHEICIYTNIIKLIIIIIIIMFIFFVCPLLNVSLSLSLYECLYFLLAWIYIFIYTK